MYVLIASMIYLATRLIMTENKIKKKVGRPTKYDKIDLVQIEKLAGMGLTEEQIASVIDVHRDTLNEYKKKYPEFSDTIKKGKEKADLQIVKSLYQRAMGYEHPELYVTQYKGEIITKEIIKHYPPDTGAACFWLKNRQPDKWKDKQEVEHSGNLSYEISEKFLPKIDNKDGK